jgi:hypothetical protein
MQTSNGCHRLILSRSTRLVSLVVRRVPEGALWISPRQSGLAHIRAGRLFESAGRQGELVGGVATTARLMLDNTSNKTLDRSAVSRFEMPFTS